MKSIIFDCDNTMGIAGCDADDGLALLYLLGKPGVEICGITATYGNSDIETVYANTGNILKEIGHNHIPLLKGSPNPHELRSEAAEFIIETVKREPGQISILATGSLTNLYAAHKLQPDVLSSVNEIVLMGGITSELIIGGKVLAELNFTCDPIAAECVLAYGHRVSVITGNNCLDAFFTRQDFAVRFLNSNRPAARYIENKCQYWFDYMEYLFNLDGFHNWDVVAAAYIAQPDLFNNNWQSLKPDEDMHRGFLNLVERDQGVCDINLPSIKNTDKFADDVYQTWLGLNLAAK